MNFDGQSLKPLVPNSIIVSGFQKPDREGGPCSQILVMKKFSCDIFRMRQPTDSSGALLTRGF